MDSLPERVGTVWHQAPAWSIAKELPAFVEGQNVQRKLSSRGCRVSDLPAAECEAIQENSGDAAADSIQAGDRPLAL